MSININKKVIIFDCLQKQANQKAKFANCRVWRLWEKSIKITFTLI